MSRQRKEVKEVSEEPKHDPQEDDPKLGKIIRKAGKEARRRVLGNKPLDLGQGFQIWAIQKEILREKGVDWKTPAELNPRIKFD